MRGIGGNMKDYFEHNRGLLYEIHDISQELVKVTANTQVTEPANWPYLLAIFSVINRNAASILKMFDAIELLPEIDELKPRRLPI
jgi:hypothetical protein